MSTILVTGSTGTVGSHVVHALSQVSGVSVRAATRGGKNPFGANVATVSFDYDDPASLRSALAGVDKVFLLTPFTPNQVELAGRLLEVAKASGVTHVVKLSAIGCDVEPGIQLGRWHRAAEQRIEASGLAYTFLRPNNFFENFLNYYPPQVDGNIYLPWGSAGVSFLAAADIAEVAKLAFTKPGHEGKAYSLTGSQSLTIEHAARVIGEVTGRTIRYVDVPEEAARKGMLDAGMPGWMVDAMMELHAIDKAGYAAAIAPDLVEVLGRPAQTFEEFAKLHADRWRA
jgi:uncharacterized protein YbjT (DUF2867 family)